MISTHGAGIIWPDGEDELSPNAVDFISKACSLLAWPLHGIVFVVPALTRNPRWDRVQLLAIEPSKRLGAKGAEEVKGHPWFDGVDWANLRDAPSPFVPKLERFEDTFYFEGEPPRP